VEYDAARQRDPERPVAGAHRRHDEQRKHERVDEAAHAPRVRVDPIEQQRIGEEIEVEDERAGESQAEGLHVPAGILRQAAKELFQQHETENRQRQALEEREASGVSERRQSQCNRDLREQAQDDERGGYGHKPRRARRGAQRRPGGLPSATAGMHTRRRAQDIDDAAEYEQPGSRVTVSRHVDDRPGCVSATAAASARPRWPPRQPRPR
jgi:hypothetical protein